jgi:hypothetical protein
VVVGYFGSAFDLSLFTFLRDPLPAGTDPVCDACIRQWLIDGRIQLTCDDIMVADDQRLLRVAPDTA